MYYTGYEVLLIFCPTDTSIDGSGIAKETELLYPDADPMCQTSRYKLDSSTLFFVLNNEVLPDYEHKLTFTVSHSFLCVLGILNVY